jgi:TetR/AcrR family transcriptional regulator, transcriptional repressor for nem operon
MTHTYWYVSYGLLGPALLAEQTPTPGNTLLTRAILACILVGMLDVIRTSKRKGTASRDPERTRGRLLQAAFEEIHLSGFRSADVDAILAKAGVTKGALYYHFDSKEALGYAVVDEVIADIARAKWWHPLRNPPNPIDTLVGIVQSTSLKPKDLQRGCALNNLAQEMSPIDEGFRKRTARLFKRWHDAIAGALRTGQKHGVVRTDVDPDKAATFLIAAYEGYFSLAKNSQDARVLRSGLKNLIAYLEGLRVRRTRVAAGRRG